MSKIRTKVISSAVDASILSEIQVNGDAQTRLSSSLERVEREMATFNDRLARPLLHFLMNPQKALTGPDTSVFMDFLRTSEFMAQLDRLEGPPLTVYFPPEFKPNENRCLATVNGLSVLRDMKIPVNLHQLIGQQLGLYNLDLQTVEGEGWDKRVVDDVSAGIRHSDIVTMVKEPNGLLRHVLNQFKHKTIFSYLHPNARSSADWRDEMTACQHWGISFDMIPGGLTLAPMSTIAASYVMNQMFAMNAVEAKSSEGISFKTGHLGWIPGYPADNSRENTVLILGIGGTVGQTAATVALHRGAKVIGTDVDGEKLAALQHQLDKNVPWLKERLRLINTQDEPVHYDRLLRDALYVIDGIKLQNRPTPVVINRAMQKQSSNIYGVIAADEGGAIEGAPGNSNKDRYSIVGKNMYFASQNMPSNYPSPASQRLSVLTLPYLLLLAKVGPFRAVQISSSLAKATAFCEGKVFQNGLSNEDVANLVSN